MSDRRSFVYGVVAAPAAVRVTAAGVGGAPVRAVERGALAALVSDLDADAVPGRREDLDAHARVLAQAIESGTVVPMRFGVSLDDDDAVRARLLARNEAVLAELLRALDGHVQATLKVFYLEDALLRHVVRSNPEIGRLREQTRGREDAASHAARVQLGQLVSQAVEAQRAADGDAILARLAPLAADVRVEQPAHERIALHAQLLVARERAAQLEAAVAEMAAEHGERLRVRYVAPLAPFSFSEVALDAEEPSWA
jgi:Gas vesicle synthesis protein GvpL/GvpF